MQNDDVWNVRLKELKDAGRGVLQEEELTKLTKCFISESEQLIVVNLRKEYNRMPEYWADGLHGHFNQTPKNLEQNENECLREVLATIHVRIEDGKYQINQFNLATLSSCHNSKNLFLFLSVCFGGSVCFEGSVVFLNLFIAHKTRKAA